MKNKGESYLSVSKLKVVYHHISIAIQGVSLNISEGQFFSIIGANGAGKTTLLRSISGFLSSDSAEIIDGEIFFMDERLNGLPPHKITNMGIVLVPERNKVFETLSTEKNLSISGFQSRDRKRNEQIIYEYFPNLEVHKHHLAGYLSGGERQMLAIGQALLCSPKLLLLDEVSMGLSPLMVSFLLKTLLRMKNDLGLTILLVEQNAYAALEIADYAAVMENGRIVLDGIPQNLLIHEDVREFYLGIRKTGEKSYKDVKPYRRTRSWWG